jgi:hypothetical protein
MNRWKIILTFSEFSSYQASKLRLGRNKSMTIFKSDYVITYVNCLPLVVTLISEANGNIGAVLAVAEDIKKALEPLKLSIEKHDIH